MSDEQLQEQALQGLFILLARDITESLNFPITIILEKKQRISDKWIVATVTCDE